MFTYLLFFLHVDRAFPKAFFIKNAQILNRHSFQKNSSPQSQNELHFNSSTLEDVG